MLKLITLISALVGTYLSTPFKGKCGINGVEEDFISPNIFGGTDVKNPRRWPWMVSLRRTDVDEHWCGGTISNSNWILTAAHCIFNRDGAVVDLSLLHIYLGSTNLEVYEPTRQVVGVRSIKLHAGYTSRTFIREGNDLALLEVDPPLVFNNYIKPVCLPDRSGVPFTDCFIIGWGYQGYNVETRVSYGKGTTLRETVAWVITDHQCRAIWRAWLPFSSTENLDKALESKTQLCLDGMGVSAACKGDSGSSLLCHQGGGNWVVAGMTSRGPFPHQCGGKPFFYTNVTHYLDWLGQECSECFM